MEENNYQKYDLRDYQIESCKELQKKITGDIPLLLVMPTGTGKTRTAISFCLELLDAGIVKNIIWVAHRRELINQAKATLKLCCYLKHGYTSENYKDDKMSGNLRDFDEENSFGFYMNMTFKREEIFSQIQINNESLVVYDEAHHCVSDNKTYRLDDVKSKKAKILGLTATPFRTNGDIPFVWEFTRKDNEYKNVIDRANFSIVEKITISTAIFKKYLCRFQIFTMGDLYEDLKKEWKENAGNWRNYYNSKLVQTIISIISDEVAKNNGDRILHRPEGGKILIFSKEPESLYRSLIEIEKDEIRNKGIGLLISDLYKCRTPGNITRGCERSEIIDLYSDKDENKCLSVLINNAILTEGFDEPKVTDIILLYDTNSAIRMTQILGRGLRPYGDEKRGCYVYNFADADIINKIYDGNEDISNLEDLDILDVLLGEQIALIKDEKDNIFTLDNASDDNNEVIAVYPKNVIYDYIRAARLDSEFKLAGFLIVDELFQCFVSQQELEFIKKGKKPPRYHQRFHQRFRDMLKSMSTRWEIVKNKERFNNSFIEYLTSYGNYKSLDAPEIDCINEIDKSIEGRMSRIREKVLNGKKIVPSIKEVFSKDGITLTPSDIKFYSYQIFLSVLGIGDKEG
ncbi:MAG: DEAD/DEAH box helicase family protein [Lachnospiraceae bacterium]|nr:DEAD/DEAH box helicase family protein [Lachnospiraceae bacterium]